MWLPCDPPTGAQEGGFPVELPCPLCCFPPARDRDTSACFPPSMTPQLQMKTCISQISPPWSGGGKNERNSLFVPHPRIGPPGKHSFLIEICWGNIIRNIITFLNASQLLLLKSEHDSLPLSPSKKCHFQAADGHVEGTAGVGGASVWGRAAVRLLLGHGHWCPVGLTGTLEPRDCFSPSLSKFNHCELFYADRFIRFPKPLFIKFSIRRNVIRQLNPNS